MPTARGLLVMAALLGTVACGSATPSPTPTGSRGPTASPTPTGEPVPSFELRVENLGGPTVDISVNGHVAGRLSCNNGLAFVPGPDLPALPWVVELKRADDGSLGTWTETGDQGSRIIVLRGVSAGEFPLPGPAGPPPESPCAS